MPHHPILTAAEHQGARVIVEAAERDATKMAKGALVAIEQARQLFVGIGVGIQPPRIAQRQHEQMDGLQLLAEPDPQLAVVDLGLLARPGLEPYRCQLRPFALGPIGFEITLDLLITAAEPQAHQLAVQHHTVPPHLRPALRDELGELLDQSAPRPGPAWLPTTQPEPALDRLAIHSQFARYPLDPFTALFARHHLPHQIPL
jgi:hypothetical protein